MKYLSVCSGVEAATCAWHSLGWTPWAFSEIEPFPCAVLAHHYPHVPNLGDMTKFKDWPDGAIDLLVGGTPCQSFSVAGLRKGLADPRGNLMLTYLAIADRYRPEWLVWENVPGVLSSNGGRDFASLLRGLAELGYGFAYRILDAQYAGVPQRRRRVFVVGYFGDWRRAAAVLFERHSLSGNPAPRRKAGKSIAPTISARTKGGGGLGTDFDCDGGLIHDLAPTLDQRAGRSGENSFATSGGLIPAIVGQAMSAKWAKGTAGPAGPAGDECHNLIPVPQGITIHGTDKTARVASFTDTACALRARTPGSQENSSTTAVMAFAQNQRDEVRTMAVAGALAGEPGMKQQTYVAFDLRGREGGAMPEMNDTAAMRAASGGSSRSYIAAPMQVRRLTPMECERLQGFSDNYTLIQVRGKPAADGPRYKALGNSMAVPCMEWIGQRIAQVNAIPSQMDKAA